MSVTVGELLDGIQNDIHENRRILARVEESLIGLESLVGELKKQLPLEWKLNIRYEKKGGTFSNADLRFTVDPVKKKDVSSPVKEDPVDTNKVMFSMEKDPVMIAVSSPVVCSVECGVKSEIPLNPVAIGINEQEDDFPPIMLKDLKKKKGGKTDTVNVASKVNTVAENLNPVYSTKEAVGKSEEIPSTNVSLVNIPPPGEFCDPVHMNIGSSGVQVVGPVELQSEYKKKDSVREKQFTFTDAVRGAAPKIPKETIVPKQKVPPAKIIPPKISFPAPFLVVPYDKPVIWEFPRFRVCQSEIGEISRYQMKMSGQIYNLDPTYFYEAPDPTTGELGLKARGCFLCFSLKHNKKTHEKTLDPDLFTVVEIYVCYVCGRVGYNADNCVSPGCFQNKSRPKSFRRI